MEILYKPKHTLTHATKTYKPPQSSSVGSKSRFSPPPSTLGKRYATALPSLAGLGRASSGTGWPCRGHRIAPNLAHLVPFVGSSMRLGRVSSRVCGVAVGRGGFHPKAGGLETPQVGNSAECPFLSSPLAMPFRVAMRLWRRAASLNRMRTRPTCQTPFRVFWKRSFVGANSNGGRGFVTTSPSAPCHPIGRWL